MHFLSLLIEAASDPHSRVRVVLTLRADFYDRPLRYPGLSELLEDGHVAVHPLGVDDLRRAIVGPAEGAGLELEEGLVAALVADVRGQPGALPLLQYALTELAERPDGITLTREAYGDIGGISGALAQRAEELYTDLGEAERSAARTLFTRLVSLGEETEDTRRRILRTEVDALGAAPGATGEVIKTYGGHRLLSFDREPVGLSPTVEIAHEALLREWPRLRGWIDEDRDGLRLLRHVSESASAWGGRTRPPCPYREPLRDLRRSVGEALLVEREREDVLDTHGDLRRRWLGHV